MNLADAEQWPFWLEVLRLIIVPITGYLAYLLRGILNELHDLNSRIIRLEQWQADHIRDDERRLTRLEALYFKAYAFVGGEKVHE